jgi:hypothetical protein
MRTFWEFLNQGVNLHHITTAGAALIIQKEGFKPKSFRLQFETAAQLTGANPQDPQLLEQVMRTFKFTNQEYNQQRKVFFFTDATKAGFLQDYSATEWNPVNEGLRSMLQVIAQYYQNSQPEISRKAKQEQNNLFGQKRVMITITVPSGLVKDEAGNPIDNSYAEEVVLEANQVNAYLPTIKITKL